MTKSVKQTDKQESHGLAQIDDGVLPVKTRKNCTLLITVAGVCLLILVAAAIIIPGLLQRLNASPRQQSNTYSDTRSSSSIEATSSENATKLADIKITQVDRDYISKFGASFSPANYSGLGNQNIKLPSGATGSFFVVAASHPGQGAFKIEELDDNDAPIGVTILEKTGEYSGSRVGADSQGLKITSDTTWTIKILPIDSLQWLTSPLQGNGDQPFFLIASKSDIALGIDYQGKGGFDLIQNGTVKIFEHFDAFNDSTTITRDKLNYPVILQVFAEGRWTIK